MARFVDRRTFLKRSGAAALGIIGRAAPRVVARGGRRRAPGGGRRAMGHRDPVCLAHQPVREVPLGPDVRLADHARSQDLHVPPGARHRVEALERDADVDVQAALGRAVPRGVGRDDGRGREVHRRAELEAGRAGRHGALLARQSRPDRDARQAHGRDAFQDARCGTCRRSSASSWATRTSPRRSTSSRWARTRRSAHPIGTGPYRHVEGKQGDFHRFEAVPNHWRKTPDFKELVIRRLPDPATRTAGLRAGEIDIGQVFGDYLDQAKKAGLRIHEAPNAAAYWVILMGQTTPDREDYCPTCPWVGDPKDAEEPRERAEGAACHEPRRQQEGDHQRALARHGRRRRPSRTTTIPSTRATARTGRSRPMTRSAPRSCSPRPVTPAASRSA